MDYSAKTMDISIMICYNGIMNHSLKFIFKKDIERIFNSFTNLFDIRIAFLSPTGDELNVGKNKPICSYCSLLRKELGLDDLCVQLDKKKRIEAAASGEMLTYKCHGGMTEAISAMKLNDELLGFVMIGQFRTGTNQLPHKIKKIWTDKFGNDELEKAFFKRPLFTEKYSESILELFNQLINLIISQHMVEVQGGNSIGPLITFMTEHLNEHITLKQAAEILYQSESNISHKIKEATGKSFKKFQIDLKLDKADEYFSTKPDMTVREVALKLGYKDSFYFSRLYKKYRGHSPTTAKKKSIFKQNQKF